jgi:predicted DNA-binding protein (UPF0251 family)
MLTAARWQRVREALAAGLGVEQAAKRVKVSPRTVWRVLAKERA